jgi:hypothetical protein
VDLFVAWLVFPLLAFALCGGCGLLVDRFTGRATPRALVPIVGFALIVVVGQFLTLGDATAGLTTPAVVILALAGYAVGLRGRWTRVAPWCAAAAIGVFAVYAAPIVLSGDPTIAGFIKLDDTATWLALTDRVMDHGRDLSGLAPSTYEATLAFNLGDGYPIGVFLPFGVGVELLGTDPAWLIQPYIAFLAALLALGLWSLARPLIASPRLRAAAAFVAAQPALLYGYYLWGGVKEVAAAALIAGTAALAVALLERPRSAAALVAPVLASAGLLGILSAGGLIWLAPVLMGIAVPLGRAIGARATAIRAAGALAGVAVLSIPLAVSGALLPPTSSPLTDHAARGNLIEPLEPAQAAGIWISGDFRLDPAQPFITYLLIAVAVFAAVGGLVWAARSARPGPLIYVIGSLGAGLVLLLIGSPWVGGKAMATASPAIPLAAMLAIGWLAVGGRRVAAGALALAVAGGVLWSNALGYRDVSLAPHGQLAELAQIGDRVAGEGPTLMTEYEPYGVRHFLRDSDAEGISELRRHTIPLTDGSLVDKGFAADTDAVDPAALAFFRTLVVRRSPAESRPPAAYRLTWRGRYYEVWQRDPATTALPARLGLGDDFDPYGVPRCDDVRNLATQGDLVAAQGPEPVIVPLSQASYPRTWSTPSTRFKPVPSSAGTITADVRVPESGDYEVWIGGSIRPQVDLTVDGHAIGSARGEINNLGGYVSLGSAQLDPGVHRVDVDFHGSDLHPGSGGQATAIGPLVLSGATAADSSLVRVATGDAQSLCGKPSDWIEVAQ